MKSSYDVSGKRELFIDDFLLDQTENLIFEKHSPVELSSDESKPCGAYLTMLQDDEGFRFFYRGLDPSYNGPVNNNNPGEYIGVCQSSDAIHWQPLELNRFPGCTVPSETMFFGNDFTHNFVPFYDRNPQCKPEERYKATVGCRETGGLYALSSADGVNWKLMQTEPIVKYEPEKTGKHMLDSQNVAFYSETEKCYVLYPRVWKTADGLTGLRSFARMTSNDFIHWSAMEFLKVNLPGEHLYVSGLMPYLRAPHYYIGAATRFFVNRGAATDVTFIFTRDGKTMLRPFPEGWLRPGLDESRWSNRMNYMAWGMAQISPEEQLFYHGHKKLMYKIRTDGFVSLATVKVAGGSFTTRVLHRTAGDMELNLSTSAAGGFKLAVCDVDGKPLPGYDFADMDEFYGDSIAFSPDWHGKKLSDLPSGDFRLRGVMTECDLYSIAFPVK